MTTRLLDRLAQEEEARRDDAAAASIGRMLVPTRPTVQVLPELSTTGKPPWLLYLALAVGAYWLVTSRGDGRDW